MAILRENSVNGCRLITEAKNESNPFPERCSHSSKVLTHNGVREGWECLWEEPAQWILDYCANPISCPQIFVEQLFTVCKRRKLTYCIRSFFYNFIFRCVFLSSKLACFFILSGREVLIRVKRRIHCISYCKICESNPVAILDRRQLSNALRMKEIGLTQSSLSTHTQIISMRSNSQCT